MTSYFTNTIDNSLGQAECNGDYILVINLIAQEAFVTLNWNTAEAYRLRIITDGKYMYATSDLLSKFFLTQIFIENTKTVTATILGTTVFGVRHGVETLLQLLVSDVYEDQSCFVTLKSLSIEDKPVYKHRGY